MNGKIIYKKWLDTGQSKIFDIMAYDKYTLMSINSKKIIAISGSTRLSSSNLNLIKAIAELAGPKLEIDIFESIDRIPHFNPDLDNEHPPYEVTEFRKRLREADGILICTPEYAMGVPGTLKNAIDWTVSSMEFSKKPTALITASSMGEKGHASLLETLKIIEAGISDETQLLISHVKMKVNDKGEIVDEKTLKEVKKLIEGLWANLSKLSEEIQGKL
jgi:NAD(P)H-dependent FMN reductase